MACLRATSREEGVTPASRYALSDVISVGASPITASASSAVSVGTSLSMFAEPERLGVPDEPDPDEDAVAGGQLADLGPQEGVAGADG